MKRLSVFLPLILLAVNSAFALTIHVPQDQPTIQAGINAAVDGDTVLVSPGTYQEAINFSGKNIVVKSASGPEVTTIRSQAEYIVTFNYNENRAAVLDGFTITTIIPGAGHAAVCCDSAAPSISDNVIEYCGNEYGGFGWAGGINAFSSSPLIEGNQILCNTGIYSGGGIHLGGCDNAVIRNNVIANNFTSSGMGDALGGGIYCSGSRATIERNLIISNTADITWGFGGGIYFETGGSYQISHNTFSNNQASAYLWPDPPGGCIYMGYDLVCTATIIFTDNIVANSPECYGIVKGYGNPSLTMDFNDVWNNTPANYFNCSPGHDDFSADPRFVGGNPTNYRLAANSPCIDAGSFTSLPDPDGTRSDVGAYFYDQSGMNVALKTASWPVVIPAQGGSFSSLIYLTNHTSSPQTCDVWIEVIHLQPDSVAFFMLRENLTFSAAQQMIRNLVQNVPATAPSGSYLYRAHTGHFGTGQILCEVDMPFVKQGAGGLGLGAGDWSCTVDLFPGESITSEEIHPSAFSLYPCSPNPFNASTVLSFELRVPSHVSLRVYDTAGRLVATLVEGWRDAGTHEVTFDGSKLASGIYLAKLEAGEFTAVQKLVLMK